MIPLHLQQSPFFGVPQDIQVSGFVADVITAACVVKSG
jgi:hypothetical protein